MKKLKQYTLNLNAMALLPTYDEYGNLGTIVVEQNESYHLNKRNYEVMESSLQYYGASMRAVKEGVKNFIGSINMPPVALHIGQLIVWMPTRAIKDPLCAWLNILFIVDCVAINDNLSKVIFVDGTEIEVELSREKLIKRIMQAYAIFAILYIRVCQMQLNRQLSNKKSYMLNEQGRGYIEKKGEWN